jgi:hypothetical protein
MASAKTAQGEVIMILMTLIDEFEDQTAIYVDGMTPAVFVPGQDWKAWVTNENEGQFCVRASRVEWRGSRIRDFDVGDVVFVERGNVWSIMRKEE